jgi:predicted DNA-binding transcriptional regulator AlpA
MIDRLISRKAFAAALNMSLSSFKRLEKRGGLPLRIFVGDRLGGYRESEVAAYIDGCADKTRGEKLGRAGVDPSKGSERVREVQDGSPSSQTRRE